MKILAVECSAGPASVAITDNGNVIAEDFKNLNLTHSETLLPMVEGVLKKVALTLDDIDAYAISAGPGSFTGIRIGIALIKGLALPKKAPVAAVSTLYAMATLYKDTDCILCCCMDARCNQVYNALFKISKGSITRLTEDRALLCEELIKELKADYSGEKIIIMGDGAKVFYPYAEDFAELASKERIYQSAVGVALAAENFDAPEKINPVYLRLPQAERELKLKKERN